MSKIALSPNASGTGTFTIAAPGTNTDRTATLPDASTTLVGTDTVQTLTNKTIQGATIQSSTIQGGTITSGTAVTASGTSVDFTGIPSWVKRITVVFNAVSTNGNANMRVQLGTVSGVETSSYNAVGGYAGSASAALAAASGFDSFGDSGATASRSGSYVFSLLSPASNIWALQGMFQSASNFVFLTAGNKTLSGTLDRVRITTTNGTDTFDAGTINIMYEG